MTLLTQLGSIVNDIEKKPKVLCIVFAYLKINEFEFTTSTLRTNCICLCTFVARVIPKQLFAECQDAKEVV
jgi:hypothetical protein